MSKLKIIQNNNNLAIAYYRYSSHSQNEASIDQQREQAQRYAEAHGLKIIKEYEDKALTGTNDNRPAFQTMMSEIKKIKPAALILWKNDRLGRNRYDLAIAKKTIRDAGCTVHYVAEAIPQNTPEGVLMEGLLESMAEFYSKQLSQNVIRGMTYNAENALYNGHKMLGYKKGDDKKYVIDEITAPIVQRIFNDYANGKPIKKIVKELNEQGVKTSRGKDFTINGLRSILKNKSYTGLYKYGDIEIPDGMPALISEELYEKVQDRFKLNMYKAKTDDEEKPFFWLTGKLLCGECGSTFHGVSGTSKKGKKYHYYACKEYRKHKCSVKEVPKDILEFLVTKTLEDFLRDDELLTYLAVDLSYYYEEMRANNSYIESLTNQLKDTEKALSNLVKAIEMGIFSETTQARLQELETQKKAVKDAIEAEKAKKALIENDTGIQHFFDMYKHADMSNPKVRDMVLEFFVDKIYVYDGYIVITCYMKNYDYYEDYGVILDAIERDKKKGKKKDKKKGGKGVRQGCARAHHHLLTKKMTRAQMA